MEQSKEQNLQGRSNEGKGKSQNASKDENGRHCARCIFLIRVNHVAHYAKDFQTCAASKDSCANIPASQS